jgi:hypothetical protein
MILDERDIALGIEHRTRQLWQKSTWRKGKLDSAFLSLFATPNSERSQHVVCNLETLNR